MADVFTRGQFSTAPRPQPLPLVEMPSDLSNLRPLMQGEFIQNEDGSRSTERTTTFEANGEFILAPSLWKTNDGVVDLWKSKNLFDVILNYEKKTGKKFPRFKSQKEADSFAARRSSGGAVFSGPLMGSQNGR